MIATLARVAVAAVALGAAAAHAEPRIDLSFPPLEPAATNGYRLGTEAQLAEYPQWSDLEAATARPAAMTRGSFTGAAGLKIHYRLYENRAETRGGVVVVSGRTEGLVMYQELIRDLVANGYSVYVHDHRGQGFSQRLLSSDPTMGYIDWFDNYVADLAAFVAGPVRASRANAAKPLYLLAHSMGGTVAALHLEHPRTSGIAAAALVTPMMEPWAAGASDAGIVSKLADVYCDSYSTEAAPLESLLSQKYVQGGSFDEQYAAVRRAGPDAPNDLTSSAVRFARHWQARNDARCVGDDCGSPDAKVGGVSYRWFNQACFASMRSRGVAAADIALPVLLLQGENDIVVKPTAQHEFCARINAAKGNGYCVGRVVRGARHSLLIEADTYRMPALNRVLAFFDCVASGVRRCE